MKERGIGVSLTAEFKKRAKSNLKYCLILILFYIDWPAM
jgi:hypothetical protein